jgi:FMN phosphatase YigB (HAD superfamily)
MIKQIIWDVDGTLYKSVPEFNLYFKQAYVNILKTHFPQEEEGVLWEKYEVKKRETKSSTEALHQLTGATFTTLGQIFEEAVPRREFIKIDDHLITLFQTLHDKGIQSFALQNGVTEGTKSIIRLIGLDRLIFADCEFGPFQKVLGVFDNFETAKPSLKPFQYFLNELGLKAEETLSVGDRVAVDLVPAKKLNIQTALVWSTPKEEEKEYVDFVLPDVYSVISLFK